jgi:hypothetical protein
MAEHMLGSDMKWPHCENSIVPTNIWNKELCRFMDVLESVRDDPWWIEDMDLKYLTIRIDTRDNAFLLFIDARGDGDRVRIDPQRAVDAIEKYKNRYLKSDG